MPFAFSLKKSQKKSPPLSEQATDEAQPSNNIFESSSLFKDAKQDVEAKKFSAQPKKSLRSEKYDKLIDEALQENEHIFDFDRMVEEDRASGGTRMGRARWGIGGIRSALFVSKSRSDPASTQQQSDADTYQNESNATPSHSRPDAAPTPGQQKDGGIVGGLLIPGNADTSSQRQLTRKPPKYITDMMLSAQQRKESLEEIKQQKFSRDAKDDNVQVFVTKSYQKELDRKREENELERERIEKLRRGEIVVDMNALMQGGDDKQAHATTRAPSTHADSTSQQKPTTSSAEKSASFESSLENTTTSLEPSQSRKRKERPEILSQSDIEAARERYLKRLTARKQQEDQMRE
uniref:Nuclear speckle splicing regulatory protein 1 N-terminal domain-containing protein n=1 Tax=Percolomonas cosmopolitus TaxID=63605 RepID=A0A7S1KM14_9EUKA|mmetsp:Transcript_1153/g.3965  ORF Transcript_1153/g.3965 Transcript_1153/m.3965 type:complete len:349 (+) Transcript_1153:1714-2760(+)